jgi:hypothetical protein
LSRPGPNIFGFIVLFVKCNDISFFIYFSGPNMKRHHIWSFYQPRDLKYGVINGQGYLMTANTGGIKQFRQQTEGYEFTDAGRARVLNNGNK